MEKTREREASAVTVKGIPGFSDATPTLNLIFVTLCFCFWANALGLLGEGAVLAIGVLQVAVFTGYTVGGVILLARGNGFGGNIFMVFASFFGAAGGLTHVVFVVK